jgi:hypothetical protein
MPDKLKKTLTSRKFWAAVVALLFVFIGPRANVDATALTQAVTVLVSYIVGQGLADIRK